MFNLLVCLFVCLVGWMIACFCVFSPCLCVVFVFVCWRVLCGCACVRNSAALRESFAMNLLKASMFLDRYSRAAPDTSFAGCPAEGRGPRTQPGRTHTQTHAAPTHPRLDMHTHTHTFPARTLQFWHASPASPAIVCTFPKSVLLESLWSISKRCHGQEIKGLRF